jgi:hypothetical protein
LEAHQAMKQAKICHRLLLRQVHHWEALEAHQRVVVRLLLLLLWILKTL